MPRKKTFGKHDIHAPWWDPHEMVVIREMNSEDDDWITDKTVEMTAGTSDMRLLQGKVRRLTLARAIVSWTFTDEHNKPIPFPALKEDSDNTEELKVREWALRKLDPKDSTFIYKAIDKHNQGMTDEQAITFFENASNGSKESQETSLSQS